MESQGGRQAFEIKATSVTLEADSDVDFPCKRNDIHLNTCERLRTSGREPTPSKRCSDSDQCFLIQFIRYFQERGYIYVHTPIISTSDCEGAGEMFQVSTLDLKNPPKDKGRKVDFSKDFFGKPAGLTVSGQLTGRGVRTGISKDLHFRT